MTIFIAAVLQCTYAWQLWYYSSGRKKKKSKFPFSVPPISVVIPFRNEAQNLPQLISSLKQLPIHVTVYWVNDHSTDSGESWLSSHLPQNHLLIQNEGEGKKQALETGIKNIPNEHWILTLDADVQLSEDWWNNIQNHFNPEMAMIVFPIKMLSGKKWLEEFQSLEFGFFQIITQGSILRQRAQLSNGAHLAFQKKYFTMVNGYHANRHISSGDDQFLLSAFRKKNWPIGWAEINEPVICIAPLPDWKLLLSQRIRWAGKSPAMELIDMKLLAYNTAISNTILLYCYYQLLFLPNDTFDLALTGLILIKWLSEWRVFTKIDCRSKFITLLFLIIYPFWVFLVGLSVLFLKQEWKGRPLNR